MAGIYIHVPFCKSPCTYCNFHFSTSLTQKNDYLTALLKEIKLQNVYLGLEKIESIYFGGGTPSLLETQDLNDILTAIRQDFNIINDAEITLEANPDDITAIKIKAWKDLGINRLSIGTQAFQDAHLHMMKRAHSAFEAKNSIIVAAENGITNISIDLIYGIPKMTDEEWHFNLETALGLPIQHLSCYALTVEENTILYHDIRKGKTLAPKDIHASTHFDYLMDFAEKNNWEHYEISNLCKPGFESKHNASYWQNKKYLGLGPAAHSFNGISRQWNIANNTKYIHALQNGELAFEKEILTETDQLNEYIMTGLRTKWGIDLNYINEKYDLKKEFLSKLGKMNNEWFDWEIKRNKQGIQFIYKLSNKGMHFADRIASDLFF